MNNLKFLILCLILALALPYTYGGCSGGGGGGGSDASDVIIYSGLTDAAAISEENAEDIAGGAFGAGLLGDGMMEMDLSLARVPSDHQVGKFRAVKVPMLLNHSLERLDLASSPAGGVQQAVAAERVARLRVGQIPDGD